MGKNIRMKTKFIRLGLIVSAVLTGLNAAPAMAQNMSTPGIDRTQEEIRTRIEQGIASGHITEQEARTLFEREHEIRAREMRMKRDGVATRDERQSLRDDLDAMHDELERKLTNRRVATPPSAPTPDIDHRQRALHELIANGVDSGDLTQREAARFYRRGREIERLEAAFKADGIVSPRERQQLHREIGALHNDAEALIGNGAHIWKIR